VISIINYFICKHTNNKMVLNGGKYTTLEQSFHKILVFSNRCSAQCTFY